MFFIELCLFEIHKPDMSLAWRVSVRYTEMPHYTVWRDRLTKRDMTHQPNGMSSLRNLSHAVCLKKKKKSEGGHTPCWYPVLLDFTVSKRFSWFSHAFLLCLITNHANISFCFCMFYPMVPCSLEFLHNAWQTFVEILYTCSTCDTGIWVTEVHCTTFGIAMYINKNCSKITVITWHAVSHSSKSMKASEIFLSRVRFLEDSMKSIQGRTNGRAGELRRNKRPLTDKFFFWKRLSPDNCLL